ncbi:chondroitinase family polysaccharide lyase [Lentisphaera profundi]|uniref:Chondroitinase family polysaccharide lyase n=1 Tax=Lentisphaera profundi TaxID=1658616 RepID=A0ABY7VY80_9BACT|nr:chondroitinase family polysaccharide lyase [Lentisphaera profundi]WDE97827.1 chondroitinase family polysaccharide lyase [Lentisphaera profundi]
MKNIYLSICVILLFASCRTETQAPSKSQRTEDVGYETDVDSKIYQAWKKKADKRSVFSFESDDDFYYFTAENSSISASKRKIQFGERSFQWDWKKNAQLEVNGIRALNKEESKVVGQGSAQSPTFIMSLYNEKAIDEKMNFTFFGPEGEQADFDLNLNFVGWRTLWIPFYDMRGGPSKKRQEFEIDTCIIKAPQGSDGGRIYFDDIVFSQFADDRHQYQSFQAPFVKKDQEINSDHWMPHLKLMGLIDQAVADEVSEVDQQSIARLKSNLDEEVNVVSKRTYAEALASLESLGLMYKQGIITSLPLKLAVQYKTIHYKRAKNLQIKAVDFDAFWIYQLELARSWRTANDDDKYLFEELFIAGLRYTRDQGFQCGSSQGTLHHLGYQFRNYVRAMYIARDLIASHHLLGEVYRDLCWFMNAGEVYADESQFKANIDYLNTIAIHRLMALSICPDQTKAYRNIELFSYHLGKTLSYTDERGVFKIDGTSWHHRGHYPAYGVGAFTSVGKLFQAFHGTSFSIWSEGHSNFRRALLASRVYSQKFDWGIGLSGRHPLHGNINGLKNSFLSLALAGTPDGRESLDKELAAAYRRLWGNVENAELAKVFEEEKIEAEVLSGNWAFPYADLMVHRRSSWMASVKGYSKNVWSSEIYTKDNRYGRYHSNGSVQIMKEGNEADGYVEAGWDWCRVPGATVIEYPAEKLEPKKDSTLMYMSGSSFAGSLKVNDNGVFAMYLNSMGLEGRLKAFKSVFAFGDRLICLGSQVRSREEVYPTSTVLFQHASEDSVKLENSFGISADVQVPEQNIQVKQGDWLKDGKGNLYHFLEAADLNVRIKKQRSPNNKYSMRRDDMHRGRLGQEKFGEGLFASAVIDHGKNPRGGSYAYEVWPDAILRDGVKTKILRRDSKVHAIYDTQSKTLAMAVFDKVEFEKLIIKKVSNPCLITMQRSQEGITLSVADPDVNDALAEDKKRLSGRSLVSKINLILKGEWASEEPGLVVNYDRGVSLLEIECKSGLSRSLSLKEIK